MPEFFPDDAPIEEILARPEIAVFFAAKISGIRNIFTTAPKPSYWSNFWTIPQEGVVEGYTYIWTDRLQPSTISITAPTADPRNGQTQTGSASFSLWLYGTENAREDELIDLFAPTLEKGGVSQLSQDLSWGETGALFVEDASPFASSGFVYVGTETIHHSGRDLVLNRLTGLTRGVSASARTRHDVSVLRSDAGMLQASGPVVARRPLIWEGRMVEIYAFFGRADTGKFIPIHRTSGIACHQMLFAGKIQRISESNESITISAIGLEDLLNERVPSAFFESELVGFEKNVGLYPIPFGSFFFHWGTTPESPGSFIRSFPANDRSDSFSERVVTASQVAAAIRIHLNAMTPWLVRAVFSGTVVKVELATCSLAYNPVADRMILTLQWKWPSPRSAYTSFSLDSLPHTFSIPSRSMNLFEAFGFKAGDSAEMQPDDTGNTYTMRLEASDPPPRTLLVPSYEESPTPHSSYLHFKKPANPHMPVPTGNNGAINSGGVPCPSVVRIGKDKLVRVGAAVSVQVGYPNNFIAGYPEILRCGYSPLLSPTLSGLQNWPKMPVSRAEFIKIPHDKGDECRVAEIIAFSNLTVGRALLYLLHSGSGTAGAINEYDRLWPGAGLQVPTRYTDKRSLQDQSQVARELILIDPTKTLREQVADEFRVDSVALMGSPDWTRQDPVRIRLVSQSLPDPVDYVFARQIMPEMLASTQANGGGHFLDRSTEKILNSITIRRGRTAQGDYLFEDQQRQQTSIGTFGERSGGTISLSSMGISDDIARSEMVTRRAAEAFFARFAMPYQVLEASISRADGWTFSEGDVVEIKSCPIILNPRGDGRGVSDFPGVVVKNERNFFGEGPASKLTILAKDSRHNDLISTWGPAIRATAFIGTRAVWEIAEQFYTDEGDELDELDLFQVNDVVRCFQRGRNVALGRTITAINRTTRRVTLSSALSSAYTGAGCFFTHAEWSTILPRQRIFVTADHGYKARG